MPDTLAPDGTAADGTPTWQGEPHPPPFEHAMTADCPCEPTVERVPGISDDPMVVPVGGTPPGFTLSFVPRAAWSTVRQYHHLRLADVRALRDACNQALDAVADAAT